MANWLNDIFDSGRDGAQAVCEVCRRGKAINPQSLFGIKVCERCESGEHLSLAKRYLNYRAYLERIEGEESVQGRDSRGEDRGPI